MKKFFFVGALKVFKLHKKGFDGRLEGKKVHAFTLIDHLREGGVKFFISLKKCTQSRRKLSLLKCTQHNGCLPVTMISSSIHEVWFDDRGSS